MAFRPFAFPSPFCRLGFWFALACAADASAGAGAEDNGQSIRVPSYTLPPSPYLSAEARRTLREGLGPETTSVEQQIRNGEIAPLRAAIARDGLRAAEALAARSGVTFVEAELDGVHGFWVRPAVKQRADGKASRAVLLNLPSGGFLVGSAAGMGLAESIPVAAATGFDVFTMDYRQAPEAKFPAASEDVARAYRALLRDHRPAEIGLYGCSAGGLLAAQALVWFQRHELPVPGAVVIMGASADAQWGGDSWSWQKPLRELSTPPSLDEGFYYGGAKFDDPLLSPIASDEALRRFPPALLLTATRAPELSAAADTHRRLTRVGVDARLHVWDGLGHCFFANPALPESAEAWTVVSGFFAARLSGGK